MKKLIKIVLGIYLAELVIIMVSGFSFYYFHLTLVIIPILSLIISYLMPLWFRLFLKAKVYHGKYRDQLLKLANKHKVMLRDIYEINSKRSNGCTMGLANNKVVCINSNVFNKHPWDEIEGVMVHEFGHQVNNDIFLYTIFIACLLIVSTLVSWYASLLFPDRMVGLVLSQVAISLILLPIILAISRWREGLADIYVKKTLDDPSKLVRFFERMISFEEKDTQELINNPTFIAKILFSHPWLTDRVIFLDKVSD